MKLNQKAILHTMLLATGLTLGMVSAQAASGFTITDAQEKLVKNGMSTDEVKQALGQPERTVQYKYDSGPTWSYSVIGGGGMEKFYVDFDAHGMVASVEDRVENN